MTELSVPGPVAGIASTMDWPADVPTGTVVFDLETQKEFADVGGRDKTNQLRMSVGVLFSPSTNEYGVYRETEVFNLVDRLFGAPLVVGFNVVDFDYKVLSAYVRRDFGAIKTLDLMQKVQGALGHRVSLNSIAEATLGATKTAHGLQAIQWFREGNWNDLIEYCKADVRITWDVFLAAKRNGELWYLKNGAKTRIPIADL